ncbi:MAG: MBOAT family protein [Pseudomonadota bacterium]
MLFSSLIFILSFLPITLAAVFFAARVGGARMAVLVLLVASLIFYSWQTPSYLLLIASSIGVNFLFGQCISATRSSALAALGIAFNLALLGWFKYIGLFSSTLSDLVHVDVTIDGVILPLAISFFTFQQIAFLADCLKGDGHRYDFLDYALFVAFFPQLIAGPIVHHKELAPQFSGTRFARFLPEDIVAGIFLFSIGLAKKVLIADGLAPIADGVFEAAAAGHAIAPAEAWIGTVAYSFQIYFDFSGYCDMALGLALLFGVRLPMNFNSPYKARSIVDFWRRWHITLSTFLRDYLYIPLGGNRKGGLFRYRNLFIVMLLGGLWHGAAWTFVVWGGLHGLYLCVNHAWDKTMNGKLQLNPVATVAMTFLAVTVAWVFFRAESFEAGFLVLAGMLGQNVAAPTVFSPAMLFSFPLLVVAALVVWCAPNALELLEKFKKVAATDTSGEQTLPVKGVAAFSDTSILVMTMLGALTAAVIFILMTTGPYEFIYFQF